MDKERDSIKVDLHVHSEGSYDAKETVDHILEHAQDIGLDAIAITDHNEIEKSLEAVEKAEQYDLIGIPGAEISTKDGHLLALGVEELPEKGQPYMETVEEIREMGGVAVIPHPFQRTRHGVKKSKIEDCDAIEAYNSWLFTGWRNRKARKYAEKHGYSEVANSDAHTLGMVGKAYTEINTAFTDKDKITSEEILKAVKNGSNHIHGKRKPIHLSTRDYGKAMLKKMGWFMKETFFLPVKIERRIFP
jgi:predicted metal-dependent phosphoesterase TrpH